MHKNFVVAPEHRTVSEDEIKQYAEVILKTLDTSIIQREMQKYYPGKYRAATTEFKPTDIYKYAFNEEKGYEIALGKLFKETPTKFLVIINIIIEIAFNRGQEVTKANNSIIFGCCFDQYIEVKAYHLYSSENCGTM